MLIELKVDNYVLIKSLRFSPDRRFNIITGETGAGKSILIGALGLILGDRTDSKTTAGLSEKCIIEGLFDVRNLNLSTLFEEHDLDYADDTILRREILPSGKSRAFINDTPVGLQVMKIIGAQLVDVHSQHQSLSLGSATYLFDWLDAVTGSEDHVKEYRKQYQELRRKEKELLEVQEAVNKHLAERDYLQYLSNELSEAGLDNLKPDELEREHELLQNAEEIGAIVGTAMDGLRDSEGSALDRMNVILNQLQRLSTGSSEINQLNERLNGLVLELEEFVNDLRHIESIAQPDPQRLEEINELLTNLHGLQTKHRVNDLQELLKVRNEIDEKLLVDQDNQEALDRLKLDISNLRRLSESKARELHISRAKNLTALQENINKDIQNLGLVNAQVRLSLNEIAELNEFGLSDFTLEFASNKGSQFQPAHKVASGGELSRLMLVLKSYLARNRNLPCIIFDEIDTGVSGEIALKMADVMVNLAKDMQVIAITHLPQIASKGNAHFYVYKESDDETTGTYIRQLNDTDRILELAKMLSGDKPTEGAIANAKELLN